MLVLARKNEVCYTVRLLFASYRPLLFNQDFTTGCVTEGMAAITRAAREFEPPTYNKNKNEKT